MRREDKEYKPRGKRKNYQDWMHPPLRANRREEYQPGWVPRYQLGDDPILNIITSPLIKKIINHPRSKGFKSPILASYDGVSELKNHILNFQTLMAFHIGKNHILSRTFATTLHGFAVANLSLCSITYFYKFA